VVAIEKWSMEEIKTNILIKKWKGIYEKINLVLSVKSTFKENI